MNRALASEVAENTPSDPPPAPQTTHPAARPSAPRATPTSAPPSPTATDGPDTVTPPAATGSDGTDGTDGTAFTSKGGEVVASCQQAGAYLISWSPLQGYEVDSVTRGPAATAQVTFETYATRVTMVVSCSAGVPSATSYSGPDT